MFMYVCERARLHPHTFVCVCVNSYCLPVFQQELQSELFMQDLNTCKWITLLSWHRPRLPMATAPSRSIFSPLLLLLLPLLHQGIRPPTTLLPAQWYCFNCRNTRLGGCTLLGWQDIPQFTVKVTGGEEERWRDGGTPGGRGQDPSIQLKFRNRHSASGEEDGVVERG